MQDVVPLKGNLYADKLSDITMGIILIIKYKKCLDLLNMCGDIGKVLQDELISMLCALLFVACKDLFAILLQDVMYLRENVQNQMRSNHNTRD